MTNDDAVTGAEIAEVSLEELRARLADASLVLVDVRVKEAFAQGHIPGALGLPLADLRARAAIELPDRDAEITVYCAGPT